VVPTILAAAGRPDIKEKLLDGYQAGEKNFRVHIDGQNQLPYLMGEVEESARQGFFYYGETELFAIRVGNWKLHFMFKDEWFGESHNITMPMPVNLRVDPFEELMKAGGYDNYRGDKLWTLLPGAAILKTFLDTFDEYPMRQSPPGFNPQGIMETVLKHAADRGGN